MESGEEQPTLSLKALTRSGYPPPPPGNFPDVAEALSGSSRPPAMRAPPTLRHGCDLQRPKQRGCRLHLDRSEPGWAWSRQVSQRKRQRQENEGEGSSVWSGSRSPWLCVLTVRVCVDSRLQP